jgi:hypothetical protein
MISARWTDDGGHFRHRNTAATRLADLALFTKMLPSLRASLGGAPLGGGQVRRDRGEIAAYI